MTLVTRLLCVSMTPFGISRRTGRIDQRQQVIRLHASDTLFQQLRIFLAVALSHLHHGGKAERIGFRDRALLRR